MFFLRDGDAGYTLGERSYIASKFLDMTFIFLFYSHLSSNNLFARSFYTLTKKTMNSKVLV